MIDSVISASASALLLGARRLGLCVGWVLCAGLFSMSACSRQPPAPVTELYPAETMENVLLEFASLTDVFRSVDDRVMGGISQSSMVASSESHAIFRGSLSLENNGGFASIRASGLEMNLSDVTTLVLRVRGDGNRYKLRLHDDRRFDGVAFQAAFDTVAGEWLEIEFPIDAFEAVWRGRLVRDAPPLNRSQVVRVGLMISDGQVGEFALDVDWLVGR